MATLRRILAVVAWHAHSYRKLWFGTITVSFLNPIFVLLSIGLLLGTLVDRANPDLGGLSYLQFVAPALLATTAMQTASSLTTYPVIAGIKWLRTYHAVIATPVRVAELVIGVLTWAGVRIAVAVSLFAAIAAIGGGFASPLAVLAPFAALLCGIAFGALLAAITSRVENPQWLAAIFRFGLVPLFLFSGNFFPVSQLPDWVEPLAWATPLWHGVELCRDLASGSVDAAPTLLHVGYLITLTVVAGVLAVRTTAGKLQG